ncbi:hypothetical protein C8R47DRAFT_1228679 [Mycena vitilis]|nr:hypothetical protein C8R47DRAFT_1228679 [Mycena vitilis]
MASWTCGAVGQSWLFEDDLASLASLKNKIPMSESAGSAAERAADRARITDIETQILGLKSSLSLLEEQRNLLQHRLGAYTYPVLTLPNEIVSEIFINFLPVYPVPPPILGILSPNLLGQICRKWRAIALTTPALWRGISLNLDKQTNLQQKLQLLETSLKRSASSALSINLHIGIRADYPDTIDVILRTIATHCARWEHLKLDALIYPFPSIVGPLPVLRTLSMGSIKDVAEHTIPPSISAFHAAPMLRKVELLVYRSRLFPWSQLTLVTVRLMGLAQCMELLTQATNLVCCRLGIRTYDLTEDPGLPPVTLAHMETFILGCDDLELAPTWSLVDKVTLPTLRRFEVSERLLVQDPIATLVSFLSRSGCRIHKLCVSGAMISPALYRLALPSVESLSFGRLEIRDPFLVELQEWTRKDSEPEEGGMSGSDTESNEDGRMNDESNSEDGE